MKAETLKPMRDDVLLVHKPEREVVSSLIYFKDDSSNKPMQSFVVLKVGPDVRHVAVGDVVACSWTRMTPPFDSTLEGKPVKVSITSEKEIDLIF